jgi:hypothetical protein
VLTTLITLLATLPTLLRTLLKLLTGLLTRHDAQPACFTGMCVTVLLVARGQATIMGS